MRDVIRNYSKAAVSYLLAFSRWLALGLIVGIISGMIGSGFSKSIEYVSGLRADHPWLILLLPVGGLLSDVFSLVSIVIGILRLDIPEIKNKFKKKA